MPASGEVLFVNAMLPAGGLTDILVRNGAIERIGSSNSPDVTPAQIVDLQGFLVIPGLVDGHIHLDKSMIRDAWQPHRPYTRGFSVKERVKFEKEALGRAAPVAKRAADLIETVVGHGTTTMRTHVDIDTRAGLSNLEAVLEARELYRDTATIEIVAFPQSGILSDPGVSELLDEAVRMGADLVGGLDPATLDGDVKAHLDIVFGIAERRGTGVDIHLHDDGPVGIAEINDIAARTEALGMGGQVAISHAFALGDAPVDKLRETAASLARANVSIMTNGPGHRSFPPVLKLRSEGVTVFAGNDNIRDAWRPFGSGDMLERAMLIAYRSGFATDHELEAAFDLATHSAARALRIDRYGVVLGAVADFVAVPARHIAEAVVAHPAGRRVFKAGRLVADGGVVVKSEHHPASIQGEMRSVIPSTRRRGV